MKNEEGNRKCEKNKNAVRFSPVKKCGIIFTSPGADYLLKKGTKTPAFTLIAPEPGIAVSSMPRK